MYDVIIVGAGPAGIFAALELAEKDYKVLLLEKGEPLTARRCPAREKNINCLRCPLCAILCGWGGAGAFSDGKLTLSTEVGGFLNEYLDMDFLRQLIKYVDSVYRRFGAPEIIYGENTDKVRELEREAARAGLQMVPAQIRHLGTEKCVEILSKIEQYLRKKVEIRTETEVREILQKNGGVTGIKTNAEEILSRYVILAPGREGAEWLRKETQRLNLSLNSNPVDIGVRLELPAVVMEKITGVVYEPKLIHYTKLFNDKVRTFCMCPYGEVVTEYSDGVVTVNGHSWATKKTENTNFALLVSTTFTEPFNDPITYGKYVAQLANLLVGGVIIQRLGDLRAGRRSTPERIRRSIVRPTLSDAVPGDLSFALPYRFLVDILEMIDALDYLTPGVNSHSTLIYGVEVKFYSLRIKLNRFLESEVANLFLIGDGAGVSRGLVQASASGVIAAQEIIHRLSGERGK